MRFEKIKVEMTPKLKLLQQKMFDNAACVDACKTLMEETITHYETSFKEKEILWYEIKKEILKQYDKPPVKSEYMKIQAVHADSQFYFYDERDDELKDLLSKSKFSREYRERLRKELDEYEAKND